MSEVNSKYAIVQYDAQNKWVYLKYLGFVPSAEYHLIIQELLELSNSKKATKMLTDLTQMGVVAPADQKWMAEYWVGHANAELRFTAIVLPQAVLANMSLKSLNKLFDADTQDTSNSRNFASESEASAWLKSVN